MTSESICFDEAIASTIRDASSALNLIPRFTQAAPRNSRANTYGTIYILTSYTVPRVVLVHSYWASSFSTE